MSRRVGNWIKLYCGDRVRLISDPRHEGRVEAIMNGTAVRVKWDDTGWISDLDTNEVELVT